MLPRRILENKENIFTGSIGFLRLACTERHIKMAIAMAAACVHGHNYMYHSYTYIIIMWQSQNIFCVEEVIDIQTAIAKGCQ